MTPYEALLQPLQINKLRLRNRVVSTAHVPGYTEDGLPGERYQRYHEEKARGGIGLTIFGGSSAVAYDSPSTFGQLRIDEDRAIPVLEAFSQRIHKHGAAIFCQITHLGRRGNWSMDNWLPLMAPSPVREQAHRAIPKEMEDWDIRRVVKAYGKAAWRVREGGLDGVEVMAASHHLIDIFLSPSTNKRTDSYGGNLNNRMRFGFEVLEEVRRQLGDDLVLGLRLSGDELAEGGLSGEDCVTIARAYADSGLVDYLNVYQAQGDTNLGLAMLIPNMSFGDAPFVHLAAAIKKEVDLPVLHASGLHSLESANRAVEQGHVDLVGMTRAHMADPHLLAKLQGGRSGEVRPCVGANYCIDRVAAGRDLLCVFNAALGRERTMSHALERVPRARRIVVVGAGPAGLEAARVGAERGHYVTLFEAEERVGGQINIAERASWRGAMGNITRWFETQIQRLKVDLRCGARADAEAVKACEPDVVIIATGGRPNRGEMPPLPGAELAATTWEIMMSEVESDERVLVYDEIGGHPGAGCAGYLAAQGAIVELVTADRMAAEDLGPTNQPIYLKELYRRSVKISPDLKLRSLEKRGNQVVALFRNVYTGGLAEREGDCVVIEHGTLPNDDLYFALKPHSVNLGEVDIEALIDGRAQTIRTNPDGRFQLFRVGDAVESRDIHAAVYDSLRLVQAF